MLHGQNGGAYNTTLAYFACVCQYLFHVLNLSMMKKDALLCPLLFSPFSNCIQNDVTAQYLGLVSGQEKTGLIPLQTLLGLMLFIPYKR